MARIKPGLDGADEGEDLLDQLPDLDPENYTQAEAEAYEAALEQRRAQLPPRRVLPPDLAELYDQIKKSATSRMIGIDDTPVPFDKFEVYDAMMGGMGVVLKARDPELERWVAIKLWIQSGPAAQEALIAEARTLAKFSHENVVTIHDTGRWRDRTYFVMEWIDGMDGSAWMQELLLWENVRDVFVMAGEGLAAAHKVGIQHRDFKPANMLISTDWRVVVADFGVADSLRTHPDADVRRESSAAGTLAYMAPERMLGERGDARSDQFSFCVALWRALYKMRPFSGETAEELLVAIEDGVIWRDMHADVPRWLGDVVHRGLAFDPNDRYPNMESLVRALLPEEHPNDWLADDWFDVPADDEPDPMLHAPIAEPPAIQAALAEGAASPVLSITAGDQQVLGGPPLEDRRSSPWIVFAGPVALLGVVALAVVTYTRLGSTSSFSTIAVQVEGPPMHPASSELGCVVDDTDLDLDPVVVDVCRLIRTNQIETADMLWLREQSLREQDPERTNGLGDDLRVIAATFLLQAEELKRLDPARSKKAAGLAHLRASNAALHLGQDDLRLREIIAHSRAIADMD